MAMFDSLQNLQPQHFRKRIGWSGDKIDLINQNNISQITSVILSMITIYTLTVYQGSQEYQLIHKEVF